MYNGNAVVELCFNNGDKSLFNGIISNQINMREFFSLKHVYLYPGCGNRVKIDPLSASDWEYLFCMGKVEHDYYNFCLIKGNLLTELSLAKEHIPQEVIDVVYKDGLRKGRYKKLDEYMFLCRNLDVLSFLIDHGAVFKTRKRWFKPIRSTMEQWFCGINDDDDLFNGFISIIKKHPQAIDEEFIKDTKNWLNLIHSVSILSGLYERDRGAECYDNLKFWTEYLRKKDIIHFNADYVINSET